ncbi:MAG: hypothetical protein AB2591_20245 [Candidatus Thiodiazotropha sp.]
MQSPKISPIGLYDLLARVLPGAALILALFWAREQPIDKFVNSVGIPDSIGTYLLLLGASFIVGILLSSIAGAIFEIFLQAISKIHSPLVAYTANDYWRRMDIVGRREAGPGEVLAKIAAEVTMCEGLIVGTTLVLVVSSRPIPLEASAWTLGILMLIWVVRIVALIHRIDSYERALAPSSSPES